jgi:hypothetical protein
MLVAILLQVDFATGLGLVLLQELSPAGSQTAMSHHFGTA